MSDPGSGHEYVCTNTDESLLGEGKDASPALFIPNLRRSSSPSRRRFFSCALCFAIAVCYTVAMQRNTSAGVSVLLLTAWFSMAAMAAEPQNPRRQSAKVTKVNDGDSIEVQLESGPAGYDCRPSTRPSTTSLMGQSSAALKTLLPLGSSVELEVITQDPFRRLVAVVWLLTDGKRVNVNEAMLKQGHAWALRRYMRDPRFCDLEAEARDQKLGLWAQPVADWIYPPEWRFLKNGEIRAAHAVRGNA